MLVEMQTFRGLVADILLPVISVDHLWLNPMRFLWWTVAVLGFRPVDRRLRFHPVDCWLRLNPMDVWLRLNPMHCLLWWSINVLRWSIGNARSQNRVGRWRFGGCARNQTHEEHLQGNEINGTLEFTFDYFSSLHIRFFLLPFISKRAKVQKALSVL